MVTFLEELYAMPDTRGHIMKTFKLVEYSKKYAIQGAKNKKEEKNLLKEAKESQLSKDVPT